MRLDLQPRPAIERDLQVTDTDLLGAQEQRELALLMADIDRVLDMMFSEADTVGPDARSKLRGILAHYAKNPHPFRACVRDNMKRFGPGRTEKVCATLKDIIRGTTRWRHGGDMVAASDQQDLSPYNLTNAERTQILVTLSDEDFAALEEVILNRA